MTQRLAQMGIAVVGILLCAVVANLMPPLWPGVSGRDFRPQEIVMAVMLFILSALLRGAAKWHWVNLVAALAIVEIITMAIISYFTGYTGAEIFDSSNLEWLAFMNKYIGLPWLLGLGIGSLWLKIRRQRSQKEE
jgi:hypothetical protein